MKLARASITTLAVLAVMSFGVVTQIPVAAGYNGQELAMYDDAFGATSVCFTGTNQNNQNVTGCGSAVPGQQTDYYGWWWVGSVLVALNTYTPGSASVPQRQGPNYWCFDARSPWYGSACNG